MSLDSNALVTLAEAKTYLGISGSDDDTLLNSLINNSSTAIESYCDRNFIAQNYSEFYNGLGQRKLRLRNFPVTSIQRLATGSKLAMTVSSTDTTDLRASVEVREGKINLQRFASNGTESNTELTFATYKTTSALAAQITSTTGFSAEANDNALTADLYRVGAIDLMTGPGQLYYPDLADTQYRIHDDRATIEFIDASDYAFFGRGSDEGIRMPSSFAGILVDYTAGYTNVDSIPKDLKQACLLMVQYLFNLSKQDTTLASETIGAYSYSTATELLTGENQIAMLLAPYVDRK
jgi:hypothetical protein